MVAIRNSRVPFTWTALVWTGASLSFGAVICLSNKYPLVGAGMPGPAVSFTVLAWALSFLVFSQLIYDHDDVGSRSVTVVRRRIPFSPLRFASWMRREWREWRYANRHIVHGAIWSLGCAALALAPAAFSTVAAQVPALGPYVWAADMLRGVLLIVAGLSFMVSIAMLLMALLGRAIFSAG